MYHSRNFLPLFTLLALTALLITVVPPATQSQDTQPPMEKDSPPDTFPYTRPAIPEDLNPGGRLTLPTRIKPNLPTAIFPTAIVRDVVVDNDDPTLINTDIGNDGETTIAIDPNNTNETIPVVSPKIIESVTAPITY